VGGVVVPMKEKDFYPIVERWAKINLRGTNGAIEVKLCKKKSFPYSEIYEHQWRNLEIVNEDDMFFISKIPDEGISQKPFDIFYLGEAQGWFCIIFYTRGKKRFYFITGDNLQAHKEGSKRKSITEEECSTLATHFFSI